MGLVREIVQRADSWVNAMTGLGTLRDKLMHTQVVAGQKLTDPVLEALFNDDDVARRVVGRLPRDATRRGFRIEITERAVDARGDAYGDEPADDPADEYESPTARRGAETSAAQAVADQNADVERLMLLAFARLEGMPKLRDGWIWARLYGGGSGVFVGADDGLPVDQPLNEAAIRSIKFLNIVKRPQLSIHSRYEDLEAPNYGKPELYLVNQASGILAPRTGLVVHESRLILFDGALTARMTIESPTGFDDSVLQSAMAPLQQTASAWQSIAHLMTDASQGVLKIANLVDLVAAGGTETLRSRIQLMDLARSVCRAILIDAEKESFERVSTSFAGLPEVMDRLMQRMCAAAEQPATLLYGRSPAGMNATGESDIRGWYDTVAEGQTDELKPRLERLVKLMFLAKDSPTRGVEPESWCIEFNPLWLPTDKELADTKKVKADTYVALVTGNIMTDAEAGIGLAADFPEIDVESRTELAEADAEEGVRPREVNTPEPPPMDPNDPEGGGNGGIPKGRSDSNQPRVPAGSPEGGQFTSTGGTGSARAAAVSALTSALERKLVARYGMPAKQAALQYERDIKAQMKAAKLQRAESRAFAKAAQAKGPEAINKSLTAMRTAIAGKSDRDARMSALVAKREAAAKKAAATRAAKKAAKVEEQKAAAAASVDDIHKATANTRDLQGAREVATKVVANYLGGGAQRGPDAINSYVHEKDLSRKGWRGYNKQGGIVLDHRVAASLRNKPDVVDLETQDAKINALKRERQAFLEQPPGTPGARDAYSKARALDAPIHEAEQQKYRYMEHREALRTMVHEELHSFGAIQQKWEPSKMGIYKKHGAVAEEVATEVLARDIVSGKAAREPGFLGGSYETEIRGVLGAMRDSAKSKHVDSDHYETLVRASKSYKQTTTSDDLMGTLHGHIMAHGSGRYDERILGIKLKKLRIRRR